MLRHVVMYKLKNNSSEQRRLLVEKFMSMKGKIESLLNIESGSDILGLDRSFDVALICTFNNKEGLDQYAIHPVHLPVKEYVHGVVDKAHSVDFYL